MKNDHESPVEWTADSKGAGIAYEPGLVVVYDWHGSSRAWQPDGVEVFTGGTIITKPLGRDDAD